MKERAETSGNEQRPALSFWQAHAHQVALGIILVIAAWFRLANPTGKEEIYKYYASAVKSMSLNLHNFYYVAFDPGGFISLAKPPVGFWTQVAFVKVLGFNHLALTLPQSIAGILSILLLYCLVARAFGRAGGLVAALVLAVTPMAVAVDRNNAVDSQLVLISLIAAWCAFRAVDTGRARWVVCTALIVGLGFNIKMLQAYFPLPAYMGMMAFFLPVKKVKRLVLLTLFIYVTAFTSLAWIYSVDSTPPSERPYILDSRVNEMLRTAVSVFGIDKVVPERRTQHGADRFNPELGYTGWTRFLNKQFSPNVSWLLPMALLILAAGWLLLWGKSGEGRRRKQHLLFWGLWLVPQLILFSSIIGMHRHYMVMLTPAIAALIGAAFVILLEALRAGRIGGLLLPVGLVVTAGFHAYFFAHFPDWSSGLTPAVFLVCGLSSLYLIWHFIRVRKGAGPARWGVNLAAVIGLLGLQIGQVAFAVTPVFGSATGDLPRVDPEFVTRPYQSHPLSKHGLDKAGGRANHLTSLTSYALKRHSGAEFLLGVWHTQLASPVILHTGMPVMTLAGFTGTDTTISMKKIIDWIIAGRVKLLLMPTGERRTRPGPRPEGQAGPESGGHARGQGGSPGGEDQQDAIRPRSPVDHFTGISRFLKKYCQTVPPTRWQRSEVGHDVTMPYKDDSYRLYECPKFN